MGTPSTLLQPAGVAAPLGPYSHGVLVDAPGRWLHVAGQIGVDAEGQTGADFEAQAELAWRNLLAVLHAAGMDVSHLVKVTTFLTSAADVARLGPVRNRFLGTARPASTLVVVQALARAEWCVEVEAVAFCPHA